MFGSKTLQIEKKKRIFRTIRYTIKIGSKPTMKESFSFCTWKCTPASRNVNTISP